MLWMLIAVLLGIVAWEIVRTEVEHYNRVNGGGR